jgi:hypothetical protein
MGFGPSPREKTTSAQSLKDFVNVLTNLFVFLYVVLCASWKLWYLCDGIIVRFWSLNVVIQFYQNVLEIKIYMQGTPVCLFIYLSIDFSPSFCPQMCRSLCIYFLCVNFIFIYFFYYLFVYFCRFYKCPFVFWRRDDMEQFLKAVFQSRLT